MALPPPSNADLWEIIMQLAEPSSLLKSLLSQTTEGIPPELSAVRKQTIVMANCQVTIHQTVQGHSPFDPAASGLS